MDTILWISSPPSRRTPLAASMPRIWLAKSFQPSLLFPKAAMEGPAEIFIGCDITSYSGGSVHHTSFSPRCSRGPDESLHMNSGDRLCPCRDHLCANILCSIAITTIYRRQMITYQGTSVALRSTFICLSWFSKTSDRPWMYSFACFDYGSDCSSSNSEANLSIYRVVSNDQVQYCICPLILDYTYCTSNYTQSPELTDRCRRRNSRKRHLLPFSPVSPRLLIVLWLWLGLF